MKKYLLLTTASLACIALVPATVAFGKTVRVHKTETVSARPSVEQISRRVLWSKTWQQRAFLLRRGTHGTEKVAPVSSSSSSSSVSSSVSSSSSSSSASAE